MCIWTHTRIQAKERAKLTHQDKQIHLSSRLWILFFVLLIITSTNTCSGAYVMHVSNLARTRNLIYIVPVTPGRHWHAFFHPFILVAIPKIATQLHCPSPIYNPLLQHSRRMTTKTSETPLNVCDFGTDSAMVDWVSQSESGTWQE